MPDETNGGSRPIPDPTVLTTEQLLREIASLEKLQGARLDAVEKVVNERIAGMKDAVDKAETSTTKEIDAVKLWINDLKERVTQLSTARSTGRENWSMAVSASVLAVSIIVAAFMIAGRPSDGVTTVIERVAPVAKTTEGSQ
jgi:predicted ribonuclease toxin of YeeF-YezG toxin-antitoxin module